MSQDTSARYLMCIPHVDTAPSMVAHHLMHLGGWPDNRALFFLAEKQRFLDYKRDKTMKIETGTFSEESTTLFSSSLITTDEDAVAADAFLRDSPGKHERMLAALNNHRQGESSGDQRGVSPEGEAICKTKQMPFAQEMDAIVDVGANIGAVTVYFANRGFQVLAIEPLPGNLAYLRASVSANRLDHFVTIVPHAVTARTSRYKKRHPPEQGGGGRGGAVPSTSAAVAGSQYVDGADASAFNAAGLNEIPFEEDPQVFLEDPKDPGIGILVDRALYESHYSNVTYDAQQDVYRRVAEWRVGDFANAQFGDRELTTEEATKLVEEFRSGARGALNPFERPMRVRQGIMTQTLDDVIKEWRTTHHDYSAFLGVDHFYSKREVSKNGTMASLFCGHHKMDEPLTTPGNPGKTVASLRLIKIDTEGHDIEVLNGLQETLGRQRHNSTNQGEEEALVVPHDGRHDHFKVVQPSPPSFRPVLFVENNVLNMQVKRRLDPGVMASKLLNMLSHTLDYPVASLEAFSSYEMPSFRETAATNDHIKKWLQNKLLPATSKQIKREGKHILSVGTRRGESVVPDLATVFARNCKWEYGEVLRNIPVDGVSNKALAADDCAALCVEDMLDRSKRKAGTTDSNSKGKDSPACECWQVDFLLPGKHNQEGEAVEEPSMICSLMRTCRGLEKVTATWRLNEAPGEHLQGESIIDAHQHRHHGKVDEGKVEEEHELVRFPGGEWRRKSGTTSNEKLHALWDGVMPPLECPLASVAAAKSVMGILENSKTSVSDAVVGADVEVEEDIVMTLSGTLGGDFVIWPT
ncbi:unnamed protein product [Amoebophrya sp. A25]|nr:unnamed protein product [Amoebophrya sp. A25]|eukprot:GSA25T00001028001.1